MNKIFQIIDANFNRASEGLRFVEDVARLYIKSNTLYKKIKKIRHSLKNILFENNNIYKYSLSLRDSAKDPGRNIGVKPAKSIEDALIRNFKRIEQALRTLEEILSIKSTIKSNRISKLRFEIYNIEKELTLMLSKQTIITKYPNLCVIISEEISGANSVELTKKIVNSGANMIQLREKFMDDRMFYNKADKIKKICEKYDVTFIVNDRIDVALAVNADGVHLGSEDLKPNVARDTLGERFVIGLTCNSIKQIKHNMNEPADYLSIGPVFSAETKKQFTKSKKAKMISPLSFAEVKKSAMTSTLPVYAIGGINDNNLPKLNKLKLAGIAVSSFVIKNKYPERACRRLIKILKTFKDSK